MPDPSSAPDPVRDPAMGPPALNAPWRQAYVENMDSQSAAGSASSGSFLLDYWRTPNADERNHVVVRTPSGLVLLNRFPYAGGHLLVALADARPRLLDYTDAQRASLWRLVDLATDLLERTLAPQGINIGVNQGRAGGAGIPHHLHVHLIPRWAGDVNFLATVGQVRVIPTSLDAMASRYRQTWISIAPNWT